jgi:hypothetical protein
MPDELDLNDERYGKRFENIPCIRGTLNFIMVLFYGLY